MKVSGEGVYESNSIIFKPSIKIASKLLLLNAGLEAVGISSLSQQLLVKSEVLDFFFFFFNGATDTPWEIFHVFSLDGFPGK